LKKVIAACLVLSVLLGMVTVFAAGSATDPLISQNYLEGSYLTSLKDNVNSTLNASLTTALSRLNEANRTYESIQFAETFKLMTLTQMQAVKLYQGSSFTLGTGAASIAISRGVVINATTGTAVPSGSQLAQNQRYFCTENTSATITAVSALTGLIDGYYSPLSGYLPPSSSLRFEDVSRDAPFFPAVSFTVTNNILNSFNGWFLPDLSMSRVDYALILHRLEGSPPPQRPTVFTDAADLSEFHRNALAWANECGILFGWDGRVFPRDLLTRGQMITMLYRYNTYKGGNSFFNNNALDRFSDTNDIALGDINGMKWAVTHGIIGGIGDRVIPQMLMTREMGATVLYRYINNFIAPIPPPV